jgi:hypothetical protein
MPDYVIDSLCAQTQADHLNVVRHGIEDDHLLIVIKAKITFQLQKRKYTIDPVVIRQNSGR